MRLALIWLTCAVVCEALPAVAETPAFTPTRYPAPSGARSAAAADFNGDGWLDIATANTGRDTVAIILNANSDTGFRPAREIAVSAGPFAVAAGDLNRDGVPDLVVTTPDSPGGTLDVILLASDGHALSHTVATVGQSRGVTLGDVNRDGVLDIIYSSYVGNAVGVLLGNGTGGFASAGSWTVGAHPQDVAAGDFNHDGFLDVAVASNDEATLTVLYGTPSGAFTRRTFPAGRALNVLSLADVDGDGWDDIAAVSTSTDRVVILRGSRSGFVFAGACPTGSSPRGIATGDFNRDGRPDFAVSNRGGNSVTVLLAHPGTAMPDVWGEIAAGSGARAIVAGDFDGDGRIDIAAASEYEARLSVFENSTAFVRSGFSYHRDPVAVSGPDTRTVAADFDQNGKPDLLANGFVLLDDRRIVYVEQHSPSFVLDVAASDYDRDGRIDVVLAVQYSRPTRESGFEGVEFYRGDGHGGFALAQEVAVAGAHQVRVADVDRDGRPDLVIAGGSGLVIQRQNASPIELRLASYPWQIEIADLNHDGIIDVLVSHRDRTIDVLIGDGTGHFAAAQPISLPLTVEDFVVADLNHDGRPDVAIESAGVILVTLASASGWTPPAEYETPPPHDVADSILAGDFNNDGRIDLMDGGGTVLNGVGDGRFAQAEAFDFLVVRGTPVDWDGDGLLDVATLYNVIVNERRSVNRPPLADAGPDFSIPYSDQYANDYDRLYGGLSSDPDLHRLTYRWTDNQTGKTFSTSLAAKFPPKLPGEYSFTLTVLDGRGGQADDRVRVTVTAVDEIVMYPGRDSTIVGGWQVVGDATAAAGLRLFYPNANAPKVTTAAAQPASYVEVPFIADPTRTYKLWVRLKAQYNAAGNDSIWLQFGGAATAAGQAAYRIGTTEALAVNLEECAGCGLSNWGWEDDGWGAVNLNGTLLRFPSGGTQRLRIQIREDGVSVDQIVLSAVKYRTARPGTAKNDTVIVKPPDFDD